MSKNPRVKVFFDLHVHWESSQSNKKYWIKTLKSSLTDKGVKFLSTFQGQYFSITNFNIKREIKTETSCMREDCFITQLYVIQGLQLNLRQLNLLATPDSGMNLIKLRQRWGQSKQRKDFL